MTPLVPAAPDLDLAAPPLTPDAAVPYPQRVFCNRNLRLDRITRIGFDMDYTLAIYEVAMEELQAEMVLDRLASRYGYPEAIRGIRYRPDFGIRGLSVDIQHGNIFKMNTHRFVGRTWHGNAPLPREVRRALYRNRRLSPGDPNIVMVDTLFSLPELCLYSQLVAMLDADAPQGQTPGYERLWRDLRAAMDELHRDGSLKARITADIGRYIRRVPKLADTLHAFRSVGKQLFIITNSEPAYTDAVMRHLLDGVRPDYPSWRNYFDLVVTSARKPLFFNCDDPFLAVRPDMTVGEPVATLEPGGMYAQGNHQALARLAGIIGDDVLYVGDHLYGDIMRSKRSTSWRTAMIVPEMERELARIKMLGPQLDELERIEQVTHQLELDRAALARNGVGTDDLSAQIDMLHQRFGELESDIADRFNPHWGPIFRDRSELSAFGAQVEDYACVYTGCVSNFLNYSPNFYFRSPRDRMAHELQR
jgi:5'-nucleotidase